MALSFKSIIDKSVTALLVICAVVTTGFVIKSSINGGIGQPAKDEKPTYVAQWKNILRIGSRIGSEDAKAKIIVFSDYECPYCATFQKAFEGVAKKRSDLALYVIDFPLPGHRFAMPAARAAHCARRQSKFASMHSALLNGQSEFGLKSWADFARVAGVPDIKQFETCISEEAIPANVQQGSALAKKLEINATPTILVNGWRMRVSSPEELEKMVSNASSGINPI